MLPVSPPPQNVCSTPDSFRFYRFAITRPA